MTNRRGSMAGVDTDIAYRGLHTSVAKVDDHANFVFGHHHFARQGHSGPVRQLATDASVDRIVTCSDDGTARIWRYDTVHSHSYRLSAKIDHDGKRVTAIAIAPTGDIVVTGTAQGHLFFLGGWRRRGAEVNSMKYLHTRTVNDLCMLTTDEGQDEHDVVASGDVWFMATAGDDCFARILEVNGRFAPFEVAKTGNLQHETPVLSVRNVDIKGLRGKLDFVTCAEDAVYLWNVSGELMGKLSTPGNRISGMSVTFDSFLEHAERAKERAKATLPGTLLVACGDGLATVWQLDGIDKRIEQHGNSAVPPLQQYERRDVLHVELAASNDFIAQLTKDKNDENGNKNVTVWGLSASSKQQGLSRSPADTDSPAQRRTLSRHDDDENDSQELTDRIDSKQLTPPGEEAVRSVLFHNSNVSSIRMVFDPDDGAVLLSGTVKGSVAVWDLEGPDAGEMTAELRSMGLIELSIPIIMIVVNFIQFSVFAFGPAIPWHEEVRVPAVVVYEIAVFDFHRTFRIDKELIFWPKQLATLLLMSLFFLSAIFNLHANLQRRLFASEGSSWKQYSFRIGSSAVGGLIWCCSSVLVVPMSRVSAEAFDCVHGADDLPFVAGAPTIICYTGTHIYLAIAVALTYVLFFCVLVPYAVVAGDVRYVQSSELFAPSAWMLNSKRKACLVHMGAVHPRGKHVFPTSVVDLMAKILLPVIAMLTTSTPVLQTSAITAVGAAMLAATIVWPPLVETSFNSVLLGSRFFTVFAMGCGTFTAYLGDAERTEPAYVFLSGSAIISLCTVIAFWRAPKISERIRYQRFDTSAAQEVNVSVPNADDQATLPEDDSAIPGFVVRPRHRQKLRTRRARAAAPLSDIHAELLDSSSDSEEPLLQCCCSASGDRPRDRADLVCVEGPPTPRM